MQNDFTFHSRDLIVYFLLEALKCFDTLIIFKNILEIPSNTTTGMSRPTSGTRNIV